MKIMMLVALIALSGCANTYLDVSAGPQIKPILNGESNWEGSGPIFDIGVRKEWKSAFCQYSHTSNLFVGPPFNSDTETTIDRLTCGRSFRLF